MQLKFEQKRWKTTVVHEPDCPDYGEADDYVYNSPGRPCDRARNCKNYDGSVCYRKNETVEITDDVPDTRTFWQKVLGMFNIK
jgi:hypothetical protein